MNDKAFALWVAQQAALKSLMPGALYGFVSAAAFCVGSGITVRPSGRRTRRLTPALCLVETVAQSVAAKSLGDRIIKVNHAGEHGAICIYSGQIHIARLTARSMVSELTEFRSHERRHRAIFGAELQRRGRSRCRSYWFCGVGGYVLGLITGVLGPSAIAATTVAVESVVLRHLEQKTGRSAWQ